MHTTDLPNTPRLVKVKQANEITGLPQRRIRELEAAGEIGSVRAGRLIRIDLADLQRWIDEQVESSKTPR